MASPNPGLLCGVTVLDLSTVGPSARATRLLSDFGAQVIKVAAKPSSGATPIQPPYYAYSGNRDMRRVEIDLKTDGGREAFMALVGVADVVIESFRPGVADRLGVGYESCAATNPAIIYCSTSGYGQDGPASSWAGHDVNYLAVGGYLAMSSPRGDGRPPLPGASVADAAAGGMHAALSISAALVARANTGRGTYLDVAIADGALWLMSLVVDDHLATGSQPHPGGELLSGKYGCYDTYATSDGKYLAVGAIEAKFFANLCAALGLEHLASLQLVAEAQDEVRAALRAAFAQKTRDEWVELLAGADTCVSPVLEVAEVSSFAQFSERAAFGTGTHPDAGTFTQLTPLLGGMVRDTNPVVLPDPRATTTVEDLTVAGVPTERIEGWIDSGAIA